MSQGFAQKVGITNVLACEAGESIKPGASAPGENGFESPARDSGRKREILRLSPRFTGSNGCVALSWG